jgi:xanthine/CO dehydrogenase XdhC/CoxF family maturation factor
MKDLEHIFKIWRELEAAGADYVLATVVAVEGPSYRKPGACMLLAPDGRRAGTVSGGCLEAEVARRAWWLTQNGPTVERYSTAEDDGERPYGSGCGGVIWLLLERRATAEPALSAMQRGFDRRSPLGVATILDGERIGKRAFAGVDAETTGERDTQLKPLQELAEWALENRATVESKLSIDGAAYRVLVEFRPVRPGLWIFGAGDDAQPMLRIAKELGWYVAVADGRSHPATRERFQLADEIHVLRHDLPFSHPASDARAALANLRSEDAVVVMGHNFDQDAGALALLDTLAFQPAYVGVLGPRRRTRELLLEAVRLIDLPVASGSMDHATIDERLARLHAPTGLDLRADSPETIALSVIVEIQKSLTSATAKPLREMSLTEPANLR